MLFHLRPKRLFQSTSLLVFLSLYTLTSTLRTGSPFLVELIELRFISNGLIQIVNFPTRIPDCDSHSPVLLNTLLSSEPIYFAVTFTPVGNSNPAVLSVSIDYPLNSKGDAKEYLKLSNLLMLIKMASIISEKLGSC